MLNHITNARPISFNSPMGRTQSSVTMPSFEHGNHAGGRILTRTEPKMSEEEFRQAIKEQARRDFENGHFHTSRETLTLKDYFESVVSPDRRSIIENAMRANAVFFRSLSIINQPFNLPRGQTPLHFQHIIEQTRTNISSISLTNYGWEFSSTQAEAQRGLEFRLIYNDAWHAARDEARAAGRVFDSRGFVRPKSPPLGSQIQTAPPAPHQVANSYEQMLSEGLL